MYKES